MACLAIQKATAKEPRTKRHLFRNPLPLFPRYPPRATPPVLPPQPLINHAEGKELIEDIQGVRHDVASLQQSLDFITNYAQYLPRQLPFPYVSTDEFSILPYFFPEYFIDVSTSSGYENNIKPKVHVTLKNGPPYQSTPLYPPYAPQTPYSGYQHRIGQTQGNAHAQQKPYAEKPHESFAVGSSNQQLVFQLPGEESQTKFIPLQSPVTQEKHKVTYGIPGTVTEVKFNKTDEVVPHEVYGVPKEEPSYELPTNTAEVFKKKPYVRYGLPVSATVQEVAKTDAASKGSGIEQQPKYGTPEEVKAEVFNASYDLPVEQNKSGDDAPEEDYGVPNPELPSEDFKEGYEDEEIRLEAPSNSYGLPSSEVHRSRSEYGPPPPSPNCLTEEFYGFPPLKQPTRKQSHSYNFHQSMEMQSNRKIDYASPKEHYMVQPAASHPGAYLEPPSHETVVFKFVRRHDGTGLPAVEETTFNLLPYFNIKMPFVQDNKKYLDIFQVSPDWDNHKTFKKDRIDYDYEGYGHIGEVPLDKHSVFDKDSKRLFDSYGAPLH